MHQLKKGMTLHDSTCSRNCFTHIRILLWLKREGALNWFPQWHLDYRIARDNRAYNRKEFKEYYGPRYHAYWNEAAAATDAQKHMALLSVLELHFDRTRMQLQLI